MIFRAERFEFQLFIPLYGVLTAVLFSQKAIAGNPTEGRDVNVVCNIPKWKYSFLIPVAAYICRPALNP